MSQPTDLFWVAPQFRRRTMFPRCFSMRLRRPHRLPRHIRFCVVLWVVCSQFPIPLAHVHGFDATGESWLVDHLRQHHDEKLVTGDDHDETALLHWHLLLPWDKDGHDDFDEVPSSSPLGMWGADGFATVDRPDCDDDVMTLEFVKLTSMDVWKLAFASARIEMKSDTYHSGFVQTYGEIPLFVLLGVSLR